MNPLDDDSPSDHGDTGCVAVERVEWIEDNSRSGPDHVAAEEPLELRIGGVPLAVVMRTPGHDHDLARGFLVTERVVARPGDIESIRHCPDAKDEAEDNVMTVVLAPAVDVDLARLRRNLYASSSCGICGKASIEDVMQSAPALSDDMRIAASTLYALPARLRAHQDVFARTGGLHAAALFDQNGELVVVREDIGRHNAVDKVVGWALDAARIPLTAHVLLVSGRVSYEVVQKAVAARIPLVAGVSAPSSLAVGLARAANLTLIGFLRGRRLCAYAGEARIV